MNNNSQLFKISSLLALIALLVLTISTVSAGENTTILPNGAALTVSVDDPVTSTEFMVPVNATTIDIDVTGTASIGLGEADATFVYVMDVSGSTDTGSGTGCAPILDCEQQFIIALNDAVISDGSVDEVGVVVFGATGATADMSPDGGDQIITAPDAGPGDVNTVVNSTFSVLGGDGGVEEFTEKMVGFDTYCTAGLESALDVVNASSNGTEIVVFVSDGLCDDAGGGGLAAFDQAIADLAAAGAVAYSVAAGAGSSCTDSEVGFDGTLQDIADGTGGQCFEIPDPGNLPDIIENLIGSTLESLSIEVDGGGMTPIPNSDITPDLPLPGSAMVDYTTPVTGLAPGDHDICVTAFGSDVTGGSDDVTQCETIHLLQLTAGPAMATNELGSDNEHTVTATILGDPAQVSGRLVDFVLMGQNAGTPGTCSPNLDCTTDAAGQVSFTYQVPVEPDSLGVDTIQVSTVIAKQVASIDLLKEWVDTTPPSADCVPTVNPSGRRIPAAPGNGGQGQNQDGYYEVLGTDDVWPDEDVETFVVDTGSGTVFGPFASGMRMKYIEAPGTPPRIRAMHGSVDWQIIGNGDAAVYAIDGSGNQSAQVECLVPPPPTTILSSMNGLMVEEQ